MKIINVKASTDISWVKLLKRKYSLDTAQKFLISTTVTCFATLATEKRSSSVAQMRKKHKDELYPAEC